MPGRKYTGASGYRYGFNGKENDNEVKGEGNQQDYGMRIYDPRLGRFLSVDPLTDDYPWFTPYQFAGNMPTWAIDIDGMEGDKSPNGTVDKTESEEEKNKGKAVKSLVKKLDAHLAGGEGQNEERKSFLRTALRNKAEQIQKLKEAKSQAFESLLELNEKVGPKAEALLSLLDEYDAQINSKQQQFSFLTVQLYKAVGEGKNIETYNKWLETELNMIKYGTSAMVMAASFLPSGGSSLAVTTSDGFLFGSITIRAPFNIPVQRFGNMSLNRPDFWGLRIGKSKFANRVFGAIKPSWNPLTQYTTGFIPKGTPMKFGIIGPQGWRFPGGSLQFILKSKDVIKQSTKILSR